jgi:hypothetical protein
MTLIEVLVALLVSVIGIFGALALVMTLLKSGGLSRQMTEATVLAQQKVEEQMSVPITTSPLFPGDMAGCPTASGTLTEFDCASLGTGYYLDQFGICQNLGTNTSGRGYTRRCDYTTISDAAGTRRRLTVRVTWYDNSTGKTRWVDVMRDRQ